MKNNRSKKSIIILKTIFLFLFLFLVCLGFSSMGVKMMYINNLENNIKSILEYYIISDQYEPINESILLLQKDSEKLGVELNIQVKTKDGLIEYNEKSGRTHFFKNAHFYLLTYKSRNPLLNKETDLDFACISERHK